MFSKMEFSKTENCVKFNYSTTAVYDNLWKYNLQIQNLGSEKITVLSNYWQIPNIMGSIEFIEEEYLKDITLNPGEICEIAGYPPLQDESHFIVGSYMLAKENGEQFEVHVPFFNHNDERTSCKILN